MDKGKLTSDAERGAQAQALLDSALLQEAFDAVEKAAHVKWESSTDEETQRRCWWLLQAAKQVRAHIRLHVTNGKLAEEELRQAKD